MNRELLKQAIKKLVLQEITNNQLGTSIHTDKKDVNGEETLTKEMGKDATIMHARGTGKTVGLTKNQEVQLGKNGDDCYDVVSITNESERKIARGVSLEAAMDLVKKHAKNSEKTYVQKAYDKSLKGFVKKASEKEEIDEMNDADEETQVNISDDTDVKADVKADKENAPINKDISASMGGDMVDKIEKIIDRVLKDKADANKSRLQLNSDMQSPDRLTTKFKDTPALNGKK
jgi:hypothetical protein